MIAAIIAFVWRTFPRSRRGPRRYGTVAAASLSRLAPRGDRIGGMGPAWPDGQAGTASPVKRPGAREP
jgi:hypothetical protein